MARPRSDALCESVFSSVGPAMAGLQIKNSFGDHATDNQITQSEDVAPQGLLNDNCFDYGGGFGSIV